MMPNNTFKMTNLLTVYSVLIILPIIFLSTTLAMMSVWENNETFTHGYLIFPISIWLIWQKRDIIKQINPLIELKVLILIIPILFLWYLSYIVDVQITQQFALILLIQTTIWLLLGRDVAKQILFPLAFLFFAIPFGQSFIPPLMELTANFTVYMVKLTGIPIYQDGLSFTLPSGDWSVVEECSGVRYLIASVVLGTLFAYTSYSSRKKILLFILVSILVPIIANSLRAFGIVMIGHFSGMTLATGFDHIIYGWVFFGIVIFLLFFIGSYWADPLETFKKPLAKRMSSLQSSHFNKILISEICIFVLFLLTVYKLPPNLSMHDKNVNIIMPDNFSSWQKNDDRALSWAPIIANADIFITKSYTFDQDLVQLNIGYFQYQKNGSEAISTMNHIASPLGGTWKKTTGTDIQKDDFYLTETVLKHRETKLLVWQWYQIGAYETPNPYIAKVFDAYNLMFNHRNDAAMITIATIINSNKEASREILSDFLKKSSRIINQKIDQP